MAQFQRIWKNRDSILDDLFYLQKDAERNGKKEESSCLILQCIFRGYSVRKHIYNMHGAALDIGRVFRGHKGRKMAHNVAFNVQEKRNLSVFHYHAMRIQSIFRGYYSRRYKHDFNQRKAYLLNVVKNGEILRKEMEIHYQKTKEEAERVEHERAQEEFRRLTKDLHHLVSTEVRRGIYNPIYGKGPTVDGIPVEYHLTAGVKDLLRARGYKKNGLIVDLNGSKKVPLDTSNQISVQASSEYDCVKDAQDMENKMKKIMNISSEAFITGHRTRTPPYRRGINDGTKFLDPWKNPYLKRGIPKNQKELGQLRPSFTREPYPPFSTRVGGNKSTALPNGLFSTIANAEQTGGVTQRHLGWSRRFGVPDGSDNRTQFGEIVACPPPSVLVNKESRKAKAQMQKC